MNKYIIFTFGALFFFFAYVQLNDPDPVKWTIIYLLTGFLPIILLYNKKVVFGIWGLIGFLFILFLMGIPSFLSWAINGFPTIAGSMKAESQYIELVREFLGVFICLFYLSVVLFKNKS